MENEEKMLTAEELLIQFEDYYDNYMENIVVNLKRSADLSKYIFEKSKSQEPLEKFLECFYELNKSAVSIRETLEVKVKELTELEQKYFGEK